MDSRGQSVTRSIGRPRSLLSNGPRQDFAFFEIDLGRAQILKFRAPQPRRNTPVASHLGGTHQTRQWVSPEVEVGNYHLSRAIQSRTLSRTPPGQPPQHRSLPACRFLGILQQGRPFLFQCLPAPPHQSTAPVLVSPSVHPASRLPFILNLGGTRLRLRLLLHAFLHAAEAGCDPQSKQLHSVRNSTRQYNTYDCRISNTRKIRSLERERAESERDWAKGRFGDFNVERRTKKEEGRNEKAKDRKELGPDPPHSRRQQRPTCHTCQNSYTVKSDPAQLAVALGIVDSDSDSNPDPLCLCDHRLAVEPCLWETQTYAYARACATRPTVSQKQRPSHSLPPPQNRRWGRHSSGISA